MHNLTSENYRHIGRAVIQWHIEPNHETRKGWVIVITSVNVEGRVIDVARFTTDELAEFREQVQIDGWDYNDDHFDRLALRYWKEFHEDEADDARRKND